MRTGRGERIKAYQKVLNHHSYIFFMIAVIAANVVGGNYW